MPKQITLKEALSLVSFNHSDDWGWQIRAVFGTIHGGIDGDVYGSVDGTVRGDIRGNVGGDITGTVHGDIGGDLFGTIDGDVDGSVGGDVKGIVHGKINGRQWESVETPQEKFQRLLQGTYNQELIDAFNQMDNC